MFFNVRVFLLSPLHNSWKLYVDGDNIDVSKRFLTIVNDLNTKHFILDFASTLDPPLNSIERFYYCPFLSNMYI